MLKPDALAKLSVALPAREAGIALSLIATGHTAEIKNVTNIPDGLNVIEANMLPVHDQDEQDMNTREFTLRLLQHDLATTSEKLDYIMKKLAVSTSDKVKHGIEFHVEDLEDLIKKLGVTVSNLHERVMAMVDERVANEMAIDHAWEQLAIIESLSFFEFRKELLEPMEFLDCRYLVVHESNRDLFAQFLAGEPFVFYETKISEHEFFFIVAGDKRSSRLLEDTMSLYNARSFEFEDDFFTADGMLDLEVVSGRRRSLLKDREVLHAKFNETRKTLVDEIVALHDLDVTARNMLLYHEKMQFTRGVAIAEFWIRQEEWKTIERVLNETFPGRIKYTYLPVSRKATGNGDRAQSLHPVGETPPTLYTPPRILKPYTTILNLYGTPSYNEVNPLLVMFFSFPLLFGLMFGDVGQGLILVVAGLLVAKRFSHKPGYHNLALVIAWCGGGALLGGFLYGSFFGFDFEIHGVLPIFHPFGEGGFMPLIKFTIMVGVVQMTVGMIIKAINHVITGHAFLIVADVAPKIGFFWITWLLVLERGLDIGYYTSVAFFTSLQGILLVSCIAIILLGRLLGKLVRIAYLRMHGAAELVGEQSMDLFETVLGYLSNAVSYTRLFAMTMVHLAFMYAVRIISNQAGAAGGPVIFAIVYGIGNGFVIALELFLVTIQNVRLHFYEFFSKFYQGSGKPFVQMHVDVHFSKLYFDKSTAFILEDDT